MQFQQKIKLIESSASIAFFEVNEEDRNFILPKPLQSYALSSVNLEELPRILASIHYKRGILAYEDWEQLVPDTYLMEIKKFITRIKEQNEQKVYLCIFKIDDQLAPNVKILRTSFYIMGTEQGFIILFQEINTNISFPSQYSFEDWVLFQPNPIKPIYKPELLIRNKEDVSLFKDNTLQKNSIYGNVIVYKQKELMPVPPLYRYPKEDEEPMPSVEQWKSVPEKLKILEEMRKNKLISDEEYQKKKTELLKEF